MALNLASEPIGSREGHGPIQRPDGPYSGRCWELDAGHRRRVRGPALRMTCELQLHGPRVCPTSESIRNDKTYRSSKTGLAGSAAWRGRAEDGLAAKAPFPDEFSETR